jgi:two-component system nitrate/nitrite response regulator NarL
MSPRTSVFLLAENRLLREALARILGKRADIAVVGAGRSQDYALPDIAAAGAEILLLDSLTSGVPEFRFVRAALRAIPHLKIVLLGMEEDEDVFLAAVRAGMVGYLLKEASASDVVTAVRGVAQDEASSPPRLCRALFRRIAAEEKNEEVQIPSRRIHVRLGLTRRQQQLVPLIARGLTNKEIASHLNLSEQTIKNHVHRMLQKVGADDRLEVVEMVRVHGAHL